MYTSIECRLMIKAIIKDVLKGYVKHDEATSQLKILHERAKFLEWLRG